MSLKGWTDVESITHTHTPHNGVLFNHQKEQNDINCGRLEATEDYQSEVNEMQIYISFIYGPTFFYEKQKQE